MIAKDQIDVGKTYFCTDGKFRTVRMINGQRLDWVQAHDPPGTVSSGDCLLGRFAALCVREMRPSSETTADPIPINLPFERLPQHAHDPGFGPVPPEPNKG